MYSHPTLTLSSITAYDKQKGKKKVNNNNSSIHLYLIPAEVQI